MSSCIAMGPLDLSTTARGRGHRDLGQQNQSVNKSLSLNNGSSSTFPKYSIHQKRKSYRPMRGATKVDPSFKGATVSLMTHVKDGDSFLFISAYFSNLNCLLNKRQTDRGPVYGLYGGSCSGTDDDIPDPTEYYIPYSSKTCASCSTRRTPLWRDAEDGTPLCNACGIRFKKYKMRCGHCWHIPKKDVKTYPNCPLCGEILRVTIGRRSAW